ncbi:MAG: TIGR02266 family protein [Deltaproteobacteria bacterium]|nr:MAG: TIGR02266 family protein [Deltaproteobacteria bacterium]
MTTIDENTERREHIRAPIELKVEYKKLNTFFADYTKNISKGGTFIRTERPLPVGTEFLFRLVIPKLPEPVELKGTVVWINSREEKARPEVEELGMGIRFVYRDDEQRNQFMQMVEKMMRESLGDLLFSKLMEQESD